MLVAAGRTYQAARSATTASSTGKPAGVTRNDPSPPLSTKPWAANTVVRNAGANAAIHIVSLQAGYDLQASEFVIA